jgi:hypothetical protein
MSGEIPESVAASLTLQPLLSGGDDAREDIVLPGHLDRGGLDFSVASLLLIDDYLNAVHAHEQTALGSSLLTTIEATAFYVGEIIRRLATGRNYEWVTIGDDLPQTGGTPPCQMEIGTVRALRADDGEICLPSRAVLRVILRGQKARSVQSFARGAIESTGAAAPAPELPTRAPRGRRSIAA